jgi:hypothetical protein
MLVVVLKRFVSVKTFVFQGVSIVSVPLDVIGEPPIVSVELDAATLVTVPLPPAVTVSKIFVP